jgi:hypothetical protein
MRARNTLPSIFFFLTPEGDGGGVGGGVGDGDEEMGEVEALVGGRGEMDVGFAVLVA